MGTKVEGQAVEPSRRISKGVVDDDAVFVHGGKDILDCCDDGHDGVVVRCSLSKSSSV